ncbi:TonB family protein [Paucibacter sp. AS339]|uniref:TonB family protein n=1 Tax=Paucibacter hankyongi TaxID=3133434 RepID=UPI0030A01C2F
MIRRLRHALPESPTLSRLLMLMVLSSAGVTAAQGQGASAAPSASPAAVSAEERAQQQADKVFTWIRLHAEKPQAKRVVATPTESATAANSAVAQAKAAAKQPSKPAANNATAAAVSAAAVMADAGQRTQPAAPQYVAQPEPAADLALLASASQASASTARELMPPAKPAPVPEPEPELAALQLLHKVDPELPRQLYRDFRGGTVMLRFVVQPDGSVDQAEALNASNKRLAVAAVSALNQWRFAPINAPRTATVEIGFQVE